MCKIQLQTLSMDFLKLFYLLSSSVKHVLECRWGQDNDLIELLYYGWRILKISSSNKFSSICFSIKYFETSRWPVEYAQNVTKYLDILATHKKHEERETNNEERKPLLVNPKNIGNLFNILLEFNITFSAAMNTDSKWNLRGIKQLKRNPTTVYDEIPFYFNLISSVTSWSDVCEPLNQPLTVYGREGKSGKLSNLSWITWCRFWRKWAAKRTKNSRIELLNFFSSPIFSLVHCQRSVLIQMNSILRIPWFNHSIENP